MQPSGWKSSLHGNISLHTHAFVVRSEFLMFFFFFCCILYAVTVTEIHVVYNTDGPFYCRFLFLLTVDMVVAVDLWAGCNEVPCKCLATSPNIATVHCLVKGCRLMSYDWHIVILRF